MWRFLFCTCPGDPTDNILVKEVVSGVAGGVSVIIVIAVIVIFRTNVIELWRRVFRREPNNERRPILDIAGVVEDTQYNIPAGASEGSELTLGNGSSCSDIIVQKKKNDLNSKINTYAEGLGWGCPMTW